MTITAIKSAMESFKQLYSNSSIIEVMYIEEITETIKVKFVDSGLITYITKSSISDKLLHEDYIKLDDMLILRFEGFRCTK